MFAFLLFLLAVEPSPPPKEDAAAGWIQLFDGKSLFGWTADEGTQWTAADGVLKADQGPAGWLRTHAAFGDFRLRLEYRVSKPETASGVALRMGREAGYEIRIQDTDEQNPTGSIVGRAKAKPPKPEAGKWRALDVTARGTRITVRLDGRQVAALKHFGPIHGPVGLRFVEGNPVEFRNIRLKPLDMACLFQGDEFKEWRAAGEGKWTMRDGVVSVTGGPGVLESARAWDDFILQADVRVQTPQAGLFFRGEKAKPVELGVAADGKWLTQTIAVRGRQVNVWVDGSPVTSRQDEEGRQWRGTLGLQTSGAGTRADIKDLCIAPLARR
jgi:hypothetical protein